MKASEEDEQIAGDVRTWLIAFAGALREGVLSDLTGADIRAVLVRVLRDHGFEKMYPKEGKIAEAVAMLASRTIMERAGLAVVSRDEAFEELGSVEIERLASATVFEMHEARARLRSVPPRSRKELH